MPDRNTGFSGSELVSRVLQAGGIDKYRANATTLLPDEHKIIDDRVVDVARAKLTGINDLRARPDLMINIDAMQATVYSYDQVSDMSPAEITMKLSQRPDADRIVYTRVNTPLPFTTKFFEFDARVLAMGRKMGTPINTTTATTAAIKVVTLSENTLFNGASTYNAAGGVMYGYTDFPSRNTVTLSTGWTDSAMTGALILADVDAMVQASIDVFHAGPWILYIPQEYATAITADYKANGDKTIEQRILDTKGIVEVKVSSSLATDNVLLVEMTPETVQLIQGLDITNFPWTDPLGDLRTLVAACWVPLLIADSTGKSGITHLSA